MGVRIAVAGATGYAGGELLRLLAAHPDVEITAATGHSTVGGTIGDVHPHLRSVAGLPITETSADSLTGADLVFLALPHGQSAAVAAALPAGVKVVDLGADHRLRDPAAWTRYYGGTHAGTWTYGLPELPGARPAIAAANRVAAAGCYATAVTLALAPLIAAGVGDADDVVVVASSGTSGAGRAAKAHLLATEVMGDLSVYKVGAHQHVPEIKQASGATSLSMTPVLAPMPRGILATVTVRPAAAQPAETAGTADAALSAASAAGTAGAGDTAYAALSAASAAGTAGAGDTAYAALSAASAAGTAGAGDTAYAALSAASAAGTAGAGDTAYAALSAAYAREPFVHVLPRGQWPRTGSTLGTNACLVQVTADVDSGRIVVVSAIDNLGKGAAGQAIQCANLMLGLPEAAGLTIDGLAP